MASPIEPDNHLPPSDDESVSRSRSAERYASEGSGEESATTESTNTPRPNQDSTAPGSASASSASQPSSGAENPVDPRLATRSAASREGWTWLLHFGLKAMVVIVGLVGLLLLIGLAQRLEWIAGDSSESTGGGVSGQQADSGESKRYICPMMCTPPLSEPGRCPVCGMELVEASSDGPGDGISVMIDPAARRLIDIQTAESRLGTMERTIRTVGAIDFDESRLATISAYVDGRLEKLYADYVGVNVNEGDSLALLYSPQLYSAQTEYVTSLERESSGRFGSGNGGLGEMARESLSELGMTEQQIEDLRESRQPQSRIRIKSPQSGTVIEKAAVEGDYVKTGQKIYRIAELSTVWLMLDLYPEDAATVRFGQQVEAELRSLPGEVFTGRVAFIDPTVNPKTRTVRVRVELLNFDGRLRPGDYATARISVPAVPTDWVYDPALADKYISPMHPQIIHDEPGQCPLCDMDLIPTAQLGYATQPQPEQRVITVPRDAVLLYGDGGIVYVETEPGRFEIRRVVVGPMNAEEAIIVNGLAPGETVATHGNFLIDSQMQLAGNPSLLDPSKAPSYAPGPLELADKQPVMLSGEIAGEFDRAYAAYFRIQSALADDKTPPAVAVNTLIEALAVLELAPEVPDAAQRSVAKARRAADSLTDSLENARKAFRVVSHGMLEAAVEARGPETAQNLAHYYCPMVPGGGGDWMQPGGEVTNPYYGEEMLRCGETVDDLRVEQESAPETQPAFNENAASDRAVQRLPWEVDGAVLDSGAGLACMPTGATDAIGGQGGRSC